MRSTDIQERVFKKVISGYSPVEVRDYLDELAREIDLLQAKVRELQEKLDDREERIKHQHEEILENAQKGAAQLIAETEKRAAEIVSATEDKRKKTEATIESLKHQRDMLRRSIQRALALQKDALEMLDSHDPQEKFFSKE